jgi:hypothetical protein
MGPKPKAFTERFWSKVRKTPGCWLWTGAANNKGYGKIRLSGSRVMVSAHRASWILAFGHLESWNGDYKAGLCVLHRCDVPLCVNPEHLFLGTMSDNAMDMLSKGRHKFTPQPGASNGRAILTEADVQEIRCLSMDGVSDLALARRFDTTAGNIWNVRTLRTWKTVDTAGIKANTEILQEE